MVMDRLGVQKRLRTPHERRRKGNVHWAQFLCQEEGLGPRSCGSGGRKRKYTEEGVQFWVGEEREVGGVDKIHHLGFFRRISSKRDIFIGQNDRSGSVTGAVIDP